MKVGLSLIPGIVVLAGCSATLEPGGAPPNAELRIEFDAPYRSGINIMLGGSLRVGAAVYDRRDRVVTADEGPTFRSTNSVAVTVDPSGNLTAVGWDKGPAAIVADARVGAVRLSRAIPVSIACTAELTASVNPTSISLGVGERFTPSMSLSTCGGRVAVNATITWSASDSAILSVNPTTGETTALKSGSAYLQGYSNSHHAVLGVIPVTVR